MKKILAFRHYFHEFMKGLDENARKKIKRALLLLETVDRVPYHYIKYIRDGIYELRVNYGHNEYRVFHIYDGDDIVILLNCLHKKTQKTPDRDIEKALKLKREYYESKGL